MPKNYSNKKKHHLPPVKKAPADLTFDYKDPKSMERFLVEGGAIAARNRTGLSMKQQKSLAQEVKRARHLAMLPFTQTF